MGGPFDTLHRGGEAASSPPTPRVLLGVERLLRDPGAFPALFGSGSRVGLVTSDGAPLGSGRGRGPERGAGGEPGNGGEGKAGKLAHPFSTRSALLEAGAPLARLFTPEHGLSATSPDGAEVADGIDAETGLPVVSLYGPRLRPPRDSLADLDLVLFDLQDVGARFYTFLSTLSHLMEACAGAGVPLWVLDRPNPLGGKEGTVEGPLPDPDAPASFLGRWPLPVRHSLTLGELALFLKAETGVWASLEVIPMEGWERGFHWPRTGLPFHPPSPGIPTYESALLYPGLVLLEATNVRVGRGTPWAFRWIGAPWMDPEKVAGSWTLRAHAGVRARPQALALPGMEDPCPGIAWEVTEPEALRPVALGLSLVASLATLFPRDFAWRPYPTAANPGGEGHLFHLLANAAVVGALQRHPSEVDRRHVDSWTAAPGWWLRTEPHRLYL